MIVDNITMKTQEVIDALIERDGDFCQFYDCPYDRYKFSDNNFRSIDHHVPRSRGGEDSMVNFRLMHFKCNNRKGDRLYLPDGTLEPLPLKPERSNTIKRDPCTKCNEGRALSKGQVCPVCGSGPQPFNSPGYSQKKVKDCSHSGEDHCWACFTGLIERETALTGMIREAVEDLIQDNGAQ